MTMTKLFTKRDHARRSGARSELAFPLSLDTRLTQQLELDDMFKKAFTSKTSAPLRSSDARKTREEVARAFDISSSLAKELLPDGFLTMKASTHLDEPVRIYMAPNGNALFFRLGVDEGGLVPTCYVFDLLPDLLPVLVTAPAVVANLVSGAGELVLPAGPTPFLR